MFEHEQQKASFLFSRHCEEGNARRGNLNVSSCEFRRGEPFLKLRILR